MINKTIYIAGPMNGIKDFNKKSFDLAFEKLSKKYEHVINPYILNDVTTYIDENYYMYLLKGLEKLVTCDCIYMLKGWENSFGANIEHQIAKHKKMEIIYQ